MGIFIAGLATGMVVGAITMVYLYSITTNLPAPRRAKILFWVGMPLTLVMTTLMFTAIYLIAYWRS